VELRCFAAKNFQTVENDREKIWDGIARFAFPRTRTWNHLKALVRGAGGALECREATEIFAAICTKFPLNLRVL
jgi:hypothetical protein